jgi:NAD(P) transhydrogenase
MSHGYDLLVIGTGPAGQKAAIHAAKLRRRVAIDRAVTLGGVCLNTGTIPSKGVREVIPYLAGFSQRGIYGQGYHLKDAVTFDAMNTLRDVSRLSAVWASLAHSPPTRG